MKLFTLRAHARTHTTHPGRHRSWLSQIQELDARLLYRGSLAFMTAAAVGLEKQQPPEI